MNNKHPYSEKILFEVVDPFGRNVICYRDYYFDHICKRGREYQADPEEIEEFIRTIEHPDQTYGYSRDREYPNRIVYMVKHKSNEFYNRVVVEYENKEFEGIGVVKTAFQPTDVREGDVPLWLETRD